jgi:hypothetical protein
LLISSVEFENSNSMLRAADVLQGSCFAVCHASSHEKNSKRHAERSLEMQYDVGKDGLVKPYDGPKLMTKLLSSQNSIEKELKRPPRYRRLVTPRPKEEDKALDLGPRPDSSLSAASLSMTLVRSAASTPDTLSRTPVPDHTPKPLPERTLKPPALPPVLDVKKLGLEHLQVLQERFTAAKEVRRERIFPPAALWCSNRCMLAGRPGKGRVRAGYRAAHLLNARRRAPNLLLDLLLRCCVSPLRASAPWHPVPRAACREHCLLPAQAG